MPVKIRSQHWLTEATGFCVICENLVGHGSMVRDHDHVNSFSRGNICRTCNAMLGMAKDKQRTLINAIKYLRYWDTKNQESPNIREILDRYQRLGRSPVKSKKYKPAMPV